MTFKDLCSKGECDVCGKKEDIVVCASAMGPISYGYCRDCLEKGLEPYGAMVTYISFAGRFPEDINESYQSYCRKILDGLGISEEQFIQDVDKAIKEFDEGYNDYCKEHKDYDNSEEPFE